MFPHVSHPEQSTLTPAMQAIVDKVLLKLKEMPDAEFAAKLVEYRSSEVALALRQMQAEVAQENAGL